MEKGGLFVLVKIKFLGCAELWSESKICDYVSTCSNTVNFHISNNSELDKVENQVSLI